MYTVRTVSREHRKGEIAVGWETVGKEGEEREKNPEDWLCRLFALKEWTSPVRVNLNSKRKGRRKRRKRFIDRY